MNIVKSIGAFIYAVIFSIIVYFLLTYILSEGEKWLDVPIGWYAFAVFIVIVFLELVKSIVEDIFHLPFFWTCSSNILGAITASIGLMLGVFYIGYDIWQFHIVPKGQYEMQWVVIMFAVGVEFVNIFQSAARMTWQTATA